MYFWFGQKQRGQLRSFLFDNIKAKRADSLKSNPVLKNILEMAERNGMIGHEYKTFVTNIDANMIKAPHNDDERFDQLYYMITVLYHDDFLGTTEIDFAKEYGESIGYNKNEIAFVIREMGKGIKLGLDKSEIKQNILELKN